MWGFAINHIITLFGFIAAQRQATKGGSVPTRHAA
jgi:hypothetical protein